MQTVHLRAAYFVLKNCGKGGVEEQTLDGERKVSDQTTKIFKLKKEEKSKAIVNSTQGSHHLPTQNLKSSATPCTP